ADALAVAEIPSDAKPATWFALSRDDVWSAAGVWRFPALGHVVTGGGAIETLRIDGADAFFAWPTHAPLSAEQRTDLLPVGRGCAAFAGGDWWVVDPERGTLRSRASHDWLPPGEWIGLAS